jgi:hypothetical protein
VVDRDKLRSCALAFPESYEDVHRGRPSFRVARRIFAMLGVPGNSRLFKKLNRNDMAVVKLDPEHQQNVVFLYAGSVEPTETYGHNGWTYVRLDLIDERALMLLLELAWSEVAPKRLVRSRPG